MDGLDKKQRRAAIEGVAACWCARNPEAAREVIKEVYLASDVLERLARHGHTDDAPRSGGPRGPRKPKPDPQLLKARLYSRRPGLRKLTHR
jgi:hypothetical protein